MSFETGILNAVLALKDPEGSCMKKIAKHMEKEGGYGRITTSSTRFKTAIRNLLKMNELVGLKEETTSSSTNQEKKIKITFKLSPRLEERENRKECCQLLLDGWKKCSKLRLSSSQAERAPLLSAALTKLKELPTDHRAFAFQIYNASGGAFLQNQKNQLDKIDWLAPRDRHLPPVLKDLFGNDDDWELLGVHLCRTDDEIRGCEGANPGEPEFVQLIDLSDGTKLMKKPFDAVRFSWESFREGGIVIHQTSEVWDRSEAEVLEYDVEDNSLPSDSENDTEDDGGSEDGFNEQHKIQHDLYFMLALDKKLLLKLCEENMKNKSKPYKSLSF